jgi:hypothetical protein
MADGSMVDPEEKKEKKMEKKSEWDIQTHTHIHTDGVKKDSLFPSFNNAY